VLPWKSKEVAIRLSEGKAMFPNDPKKDQNLRVEEKDQHKKLHH
jgi:hypothetical protein